ncbi:hypothetical protein D5S18_10075 [Nocardia panacis]|uniref:Uncharacterized protein n=1 Tax=Nocardia panacis TaxID=2340916 RepID=A0A3A4KM34_9NOCA|nr:hypothetical protein [Nocardia panacis]RJO76618.1 hypothetical protein D5S18_10075 [Nocardia panacis]
MHTLITNLSELWKVLLAALVLGAGLPSVFALGVRLYSGERRGYPALAGAMLCFAMVLLAIAVGILYTAKAFIATHFGIHLFGQA